MHDEVRHAKVDRVTRYSHCEPFRLWGGRRGVPGKFDEVPFHVHIPGWLSERVARCLSAAGFAASKVVENHALSEQPGEDPLGEDMYVFDLDVDAESLGRTLGELWLQVRSELHSG